MALRVAKIVHERLDRAYSFLVDEENARVCRDIPEEACREIPFNFFGLIGSHVLTRLGDELANAKTVLAWLLSYAGAPVSFVGFLVPIRESGSMLPQLLVAAAVRRLRVRKWVWVAGSVLQALAVLGMALAARSLTGVAAGWAILGLLAGFSLARCLCSITSKDVLGKTIPKTRRGRLRGFSTAVSGVLAIGVGLWITMESRGNGSPGFFGMLLAGASVLWIVAAILFSQLREYPGATESGGNAAVEVIRSLSLLRTDDTFRRFVLVRAMMLCSALSAPYFIVLATEGNRVRLSTLGLFIVANGLASSLSAPLWGRLADKSSRKVLTRAGLMAAVLGVLVVALHAIDAGASAWIYATAYFVLGVAHSGVRLGRKTYVVDMSAGNKRTDYVAVSNTVIGAILLVTGLVGLLASLISVPGVMLLLSAMGFTGVILGRGLPEVE